MNKIKERYRYSVILLKQLVKTDFKLRYRNSILGYLWSLLRPLLLFIILYIVFTKFLPVGKGVPYFPVYLLLGLVLWNFFVEVTTRSTTAIVDRGDLIRKLSFPRYVIVLSVSLSALINLFLNFIVIFVFMFIGRVPVTWSALWMIPLIIELYVLSLAIAFFLSAAFVKLRDFSYIWEVVTQGAFYATPILYPLSIIPATAASVLILNPLAQIIQDSREVLVTNQTLTISDIHGPGLRLIIILAVALLLVVTSYYFKKQSRSFAENV